MPSLLDGVLSQFTERKKFLEKVARKVFANSTDLVLENLTTHIHGVPNIRVMFLGGIFSFYEGNNTVEFSYHHQ